MTAASRSVLVVDDDDDLRMVVRDLLEDEGWTVLEARDGREALAILELEQDRVDAVLLDQRMPGLTGAEVLGEMSRRGICVPVVFCTAALEVDAVVLPISPLCRLGKPFDLDKLLACLERAIAV